MKKKAPKKLTLAAETLRDLDQRHLTKAAGGWSNPACGSRRDTICC